MRSLSTFLFFVFMFAAPVLFAQGGTGTITGILTDSGGAVIAGATVQAINAQNGEVYQAATTNTGNYTIVQLPYGKYELTVNVQGFKKYTHSNLQIEVAQTLREESNWKSERPLIRSLLRQRLRCSRRKAANYRTR